MKSINFCAGILCFVILIHAPVSGQQLSISKNVWDTIEPNTMEYTNLSEQEKMWSVLSYMVQHVPLSDPLPIFPGEDLIPQRVSESLPHYQWRQRLRDLGMVYFDRYPDDPRRWQWLLVTLTNPPKYFKNILEAIPFYTTGKDEKVVYDSIKIKLWENWYARVKSEMFNCAQLNDDLRAQIISAEIENQRSDIVQILYGHRRGDKETLYVLFKKILAFSEQMPGSAWPRQSARIVINTINGLIQDTAYERYKHVIPATYLQNALNYFIKELKKSSNEDVWTYVDNKSEPRSVRKARKEPMRLKFQATDGRMVDLINLRGQVVLLEFGGVTWCGHCDEWRKQTIIPLYEKYHDKGFEVVGIDFDSYGDKNKVEKILDKEGAHYPHWLTGSTNGNEFTGQFGISAVPQFILLDKKGLVVESTLGDEKKGKIYLQENFEKILLKYLGLQK